MLTIVAGQDRVWCLHVSVDVNVSVNAHLSRYVSPVMPCWDRLQPLTNPEYKGS